MGWIPFKASGIQIQKDRIVYSKIAIPFWRSREFPADAKYKTGTFTHDGRGRWYVSITFESEILQREVIESLPKDRQDLGGDLGIKNLLTLSDGFVVERPDLRNQHLAKIRKLERQRRFARRLQSKTKKYGSLPKEKQFKNLNAKVKNKRDDHLHKKYTSVVNRSTKIVLGALSCKLMNRSKTMSGISYDSGIGKFEEMIRYKADRAGVIHLEVSERNSTQTCSSCGWQHPPHARIGLEVREWVCPQCHVRHERDLNAARNILRLGYQTPIRPAA